VYEFCLKWAHIFSPYKGGDASKTRGGLIYLAKILDDKLDLVWAWSDHFTSQLYYAAPARRPQFHRRPHSLVASGQYRQPLPPPAHVREAVEENGKMIWKAVNDNHLGDCEKMQEVLRDTIEERLDAHRKERLLLEEDTTEPEGDMSPAVLQPHA
jgi:hypothetical protein